MYMEVGMRRRLGYALIGSIERITSASIVDTWERNTKSRDWSVGATHERGARRTLALPTPPLEDLQLVEIRASAPPLQTPLRTVSHVATRVSPNPHPRAHTHSPSGNQ